MSILSDVSAADVRAPFFDLPLDAGDTPPPIGMGTRVVLALRGCELSAEVTAIERLGTMFVGRVRKIMPEDSRPEDLEPGDLVRFRPRDVHRVD